MRPYLVLLRAVNVGGRNKLPMQAVRNRLEGPECRNVSTYLASGNIVLESALAAGQVKQRVEGSLAGMVRPDEGPVTALVLSCEQVRTVVERRPEGFGAEPALYHSDVVFLIGVDPADALAAFNPREGVDAVWPGREVIYFRRLSARRTRSRLSAVVASPLYRSMTIRSWSTTARLWDAIETRCGALDAR